MVRLLVEAPPGFSHIEAAVQALKESHAVKCLQLLDGAGDGRLGHVQRFGSRGDALVFINGDEDFQVSDGHAVHLCIHAETGIDFI